jgi:hypothetical protein
MRGAVPPRVRRILLHPAMARVTVRVVYQDCALLQRLPVAERAAVGTVRWRHRQAHAVGLEARRTGWVRNAGVFPCLVRRRAVTALWIVAAVQRHHRPRDAVNDRDAAGNVASASCRAVLSSKRSPGASGRRRNQMAPVAALEKVVSTVQLERSVDVSGADGAEGMQRLRRWRWRRLRPRDLADLRTVRAPPRCGAVTPVYARARDAGARSVAAATTDGAGRWTPRAQPRIAPVQRAAARRL